MTVHMVEILHVIGPEGIISHLITSEGILNICKRIHDNQEALKIVNLNPLT